MNKNFLAILFTIGSIIGCAPMTQVWTHPSKTAADFEQDDMKCHYEAKNQAAVAPKPGYNGVIQSAVREVSLTEELRDNCMLAKGYKRKS